MEVSIWRGLRIVSVAEAILAGLAVLALRMLVECLKPDQPETRIETGQVLGKITFLFVVWRKGCMHTEHFLFIAEMLTLSCDLAPPPCASFMARSRFCAALAPLPPPMLSYVLCKVGNVFKIFRSTCRCDCRLRWWTVERGKSPGSRFASKGD